MPNSDRYYNVCKATTICYFIELWQRWSPRKDNFLFHMLCWMSICAPVIVQFSKSFSQVFRCWHFVKIYHKEKIAVLPTVYTYMPKSMLYYISWSQASWRSLTERSCTHSLDPTYKKCPQIHEIWLPPSSCAINWFKSPDKRAAGVPSHTHSLVTAGKFLFTSPGKRESDRLLAHWSWHLFQMSNLIKVTPFRASVRIAWLKLISG